MVSMSTRTGCSPACGEQAPRGLDAVELGHADVHQDDVGLQPLGLLDGVEAVGGLADDLEVVLGVEDHAEPGAHERLVVGDQQAHAHARLNSSHVERKASRARASRRRPGPGLELAAVEPHALAHAHEAVPAAVGTCRPSAAVADLEREVVRRPRRP